MAVDMRSTGLSMGRGPWIGINFMRESHQAWAGCESPGWLRKGFIGLLKTFNPCPDPGVCLLHEPEVSVWDRGPRSAAGCHLRVPRKPGPAVRFQV